MSTSVIKEAAALENECLHRPTVVAAVIIDDLFTDVLIYSFGEALAILSTLNLVGIISNDLNDKLGDALRSVY